MSNKQPSLAALMSYHPARRDDPRYQLNNPLNLADALPQPVERSTPYMDARVPGVMPGVVITPAPQQRVIARPGSKNIVGAPEFMATPEQLAMGDNPSLTTNLPMAQIRPTAKGKPRMAGGMDTSLSGTQRRMGRG